MLWCRTNKACPNHGTVTVFRYPRVSCSQKASAVRLQPDGIGVVGWGVGDQRSRCGGADFPYQTIRWSNRRSKGRNICSVFAGGLSCLGFGVLGGGVCHGGGCQGAQSLFQGGAEV